MQSFAACAALSRMSGRSASKAATSPDWNFSSLKTSVTTIFDATSPAAWPPMPSESTA